MSDLLVETPPATESDADVTRFVAAAVEGPFGFKPDRNRPIEPHFDGFGRLTPEQARDVLDVRDGRRPRCLLKLDGESVLVEHAGQGYTDPATGVAWGYRVRRVGLDGPAAALEAAVPAAVEPPSPEVEEPLPTVDVAVPNRPAEPLSPAVVPKRPSPVAVKIPEAAADDEPEWDDHWTAPARSPRATALADPAERAALVRVLVLWFVVAVLLVECAAVLAAGR